MPCTSSAMRKRSCVVCRDIFKATVDGGGQDNSANDKYVYVRSLGDTDESGWVRVFSYIDLALVGSNGIPHLVTGGRRNVCASPSSGITRHTHSTECCRCGVPHTIAHATTTVSVLRRGFTLSFGSILKRHWHIHAVANERMNGECLCALEVAQIDLSAGKIVGRRRRRSLGHCRCGRAADRWQFRWHFMPSGISRVANKPMR